MKFIKTNLHLVFLLLLLSQHSIAQEQPPFWNDIQKFKKEDSIKMPPARAILFVGSSSFTKWTDVQEYFPKKTIINRGFGGSTLPDVIRYADEIIYPYNPKQVVIYCGENDLAVSDTVTSSDVYNRFVTLFDMIRNHLPDANIAFVTLKPSPSRRHLWPKMVEANKMVKEFLATKRNTEFINVYNDMLNADGTAKSEIFLSDSLHMNAKGYAIWKKDFQPYLVKSK